MDSTPAPRDEVHSGTVPEVPAADRPHGGEPARPAPVRRWALVRQTAEAGMSTAEYAVGTVAACAFAAVLYRVVTGGSIVTGLTDLVERALATLS